jgi:hypothetical protein
MLIKSFKDAIRVKGTLKSFGVNVPSSFLEDVRNAVARNLVLETLSIGIESMTKATDIKEYIDDQYKNAKESAESLSKQIEDLGVAHYTVKGLTPKESAFIWNMMPFDKAPTPPKKVKSVLDARGQNDDEYDTDNPVYKKELLVYTKLGMEASQTINAYKLMCGVDGFDLTDDEIRESLNGEEPKGSRDRFPYINGIKDSSEYIERVKQVEKIIMNVIDSAHLKFLVNSIDDATGVSEEAINFT